MFPESRSSEHSEIFNPEKKKQGHDRKERDVTFSSLLLVRKSVDGFRMAVMALASSSLTVFTLREEEGSGLKTNWRRRVGGACVSEHSAKIICVLSAGVMHLDVGPQVVLQPLFMALRHNMDHHPEVERQRRRRGWMKPQSLTSGFHLSTGASFHLHISSNFKDASTHTPTRLLKTNGGICCWES